MKYLYYLLLLLPLCANAQSGIKFTKEPNWEAVLQRAKYENKKIFVDVYATWCVPCKKMDELVYTNDTVSKVFDNLYISLKLQVDTTVKDDDDIKNWRETAKRFSDEYNVTSLPTYLFFDSNGLIIHKDEGLKTTQEFASLGQFANNIDNGYYTAIRKFRVGALNGSELIALALDAKKHRDHTLSSEVAQHYYDKYLVKIDDNHLNDARNLDFLRSFPTIIDFKDALFKNLSRSISRTDSAGINSRQLISTVIDAKIWIPMANTAKNRKTQPDWKALLKEVAKLTNPLFADNYLLDRKIMFYQVMKIPENTVRIILEKWKKYGIDTPNLFKTYGELTLVYNYGSNIKQYKEALRWMEIFAPYHKSDRHYSGLIDTYVGLLYRSGRTVEAIKMQKEFLSEITDKNKKYKAEQKQVLDQMINGKPLGLIK